MPSETQRKFFVGRRKGENPLQSNLTELNAAVAVDKGFMGHSDWFGHVARYGHVMKKLATPKAAKWDLLDVGCGRLQLAYFLWRNRVPAVGSYWGLDLRATQDWLEEVGWRSPMNLVRMDICLDPLPEEAPQQFDIVTMFETFEHVPRSAAPGLMQRLFDWTKPGGTCLFSTPNAGIARSTADNHHGPDGEVREWEYEEKLEMQRGVGFEVEASYGVFGGITRLPKEVWDSPLATAIKDFHHNAFSATVLFAAYPDIANNSLQVLRRPA